MTSAHSQAQHSWKRYHLLPLRHNEADVWLPWKCGAHSKFLFCPYPSALQRWRFKLIAISIADLYSPSGFTIASFRRINQGPSDVLLISNLHMNVAQQNLKISSLICLVLRRIVLKVAVTSISTRVISDKSCHRKKIRLHAVTLIKTRVTQFMTNYFTMI